MITIQKEELEKMYKHATDDYPNECCGILIGPLKDKNVKVVKRVCGTTNVNRVQAQDRYEISPSEFLRIDEQARADNLEVVGFYHSHPNHPARPSAFDAERAWPVYSYIIISVSGGFISAKSWGWDEEEKKFKEERLMVVRSNER